MNLTTKRLSTLLMTGLLAIPSCLFIPAAAAESSEPVLIAPAPSDSAYTLQINGEDTDLKPQIMVPLRAVGEKLGYTVTWQAESRTVYVNTGDVYTIVTPGVDEYFIATSHADLDGFSAPFSLGLAPYFSDGTTYVPVTLFDALIGREGAVTADGSTIRIRTGEEDSTQIPNPFQDCDTMEQAQTIAGFDFQAPDTIPDYPQRVIQAVANDLIQVYYHNDTASLLLRKSAGSEDVSGDYASYPQIKTVEADGVSITLKGEDETFHCAVWVRDGHAFSIGSDEGLSQTRMLSLAASMH